MRVRCSCLLNICLAWCFYMLDFVCADAFYLPHSCPILVVILSSDYFVCLRCAAQLVARDVPGRSVNAVRNRYIRRHGIEPEPLQVSAMPDAPLSDGTAPHHVPRFGTSPPQPHALPNIDVPNGTANPIIWNLERSATPALK
uniref:Uncharacterized protein n=1 Tax=Chrysotila carterae TaxID=13221 RepID=A0A7S4B0X0_CHRCT